MKTYKIGNKTFNCRAIKLYFRRHPNIRVFVTLSVLFALYVLVSTQEFNALSVMSEEVTIKSMN